MGGHYSCILPDLSPKLLESHYNNCISYIESCKKWHELAKSNVSDIISAINVDINKSIDKIIIPGRNVLPHNVMQINLGLF